MINSSSRSNSTCSTNLFLLFSRALDFNNLLYPSFGISHYTAIITRTSHMSRQEGNRGLASRVLSQHLRQYFATDKRCITITDKYSLRQWVQCVNRGLSRQERMPGAQQFRLQSIQTALSYHRLYLGSFMTKYNNGIVSRSERSIMSKCFSGRNSLNGIENVGKERLAC